MPLDPEVLAEVVVDTVAVAIGPMLERVGDLRDRLVSVEAKAAQPVDLGDVRDRLLSVEHRTPTREVWDALTDRIAKLDARVEVLDVKMAAPVVQAVADNIDPDDIAASVAGLLRKELADLPVVARTQKRIVRDVHGQIASVIDEVV